jgi:hypothetical protein
MSHTYLWKTCRIRRFREHHANRKQRNIGSTRNNNETIRFGSKKHSEDLIGHTCTLSTFVIRVFRELREKREPQEFE